MKILAILFCLYMLIILYGTIRAYDDTDNKGLGIRSGLVLHTDAATGCQYLSKPFGGITPRVDANGQHICNRSN